MKPIEEELIKLAIKDLAKKTICEGHLYISTSDGKRFYVMKPGMFLDSSFLKKHAKFNTVFDFEPVVNEDVVNQFSVLFKELKYLHFEKDLREKCGEIVKKFIEIYSQEEHLLSFVLACHREFNALSIEALAKIHETDLHLFRKSIYSGSLAVLVGIANDFYHYPMLKDFYNLASALDIGLCDKDYSYFVAQACNVENQNPGTGKEWLISERASGAELKVFLNHPIRSYEFFKNEKSILAFSELAEITLYQHELSKGNGFPRGIPKAQVSTWEAVVILADSLFEIKDQYEFEDHFLDYLLNFKNEKLNVLPINKVYKRMKKALLHFQEIGGLEVNG